MAIVSHEDVAVALEKLRRWDMDNREVYRVDPPPRRQFDMVLEAAELWVDMCRTLALVDDPAVKARATEELKARQARREGQ